MSRILFGPVAATFNSRFLTPDADTRFFGPPGEQELSLTADGSWDDLLQQLPDDWRPDFLVLWLPFTAIAPKLWRAPLPIIGLALEGSRQAHAYRRIVPRCDFVLAEPSEAAHWLRAGMNHVRPLELLAEAELDNRQAPLFAARWAEVAATCERLHPLLQERMQARLAVPFVPNLPAALWSAVTGAATPELAEALAQARPGPLPLLAAGLLANDHNQAAVRFERVLEFEPGHLLAGLNRTEVLARAGKKDDAIAQARQTFYHLERNGELAEDVLEAPHWPLGVDRFYVEWERAAWNHLAERRAEADAKRGLVRWRLHSLLGELTGDLAHFAQAVLARPDIATGQAALGCALGRARRFAEALPHLRTAVQSDPFDIAAARAYFQLLGDTGDLAGRADFARQRQAMQRSEPDRVPIEEWFADPPLSGRERKSIIVVAHNQVELTQLCLESVLHFTRGDYELILVDNASNDGVPGLFEQIKARPGPARVEVIRNAENAGFPKAVNQALAIAQGEFIVLLNNDTVVTPGWLDGLIHWSLHEWPEVGMVGPMSNSCPPPQLVESGYSDLRDLEPFARQRRRQFSGQALETPRLTGFCLLIRKAALDAIGGRLDEQFGVGFFEDDDLCQRMRQAGFKLLAAQDVFIHHFGSSTFKALNLDTDQLLRVNLERFRAKWGDEAASHYRLPSIADRPLDALFVNVPKQPAPSVQAGTKSAPTWTVANAVVNGVAQTKPVPCSLCIITKNEEKNLADCIGPLRDLFDDIVVVDTGSTDKTKELALALGARVFDFPWVDSFAAARNETLKHALGRWVFWMDADDRIDPANVAKLADLLRNLPEANVAYVMKCLCVARAPGETATVVDHIRLFRNDPRIRWKYRVHEQILPGVKANGGRSEWSDVVIRHIGYTDPALRGRKLERDLRLLKLEEKEQPDDPFTLFNLGSHYHEVNQPAEALPFLRRSLDKSHPLDSIVRKLYATIAQCERSLNNIPAALKSVSDGRQRYPDDAELLYLEGSLLHAGGDLLAAAERYRRLLESREGKHFASVDTGLRGYKTRHNLAIVYLELERYSEAEAQLRAALIEEPAFFPANRILGDVLVHRKDWPAVEKHVVTLNRMGMAGEIEAAALEGRAKIERQEYGAARFGLKLVSERYPQALRLLQLWAEATTKEGSDRREAETVLQRILQLNPDDAKAKRALEGLRSKRAV